MDLSRCTPELTSSWFPQTNPDVDVGSDNRAQLVYGILPPPRRLEDLDFFVYAKSDDPIGSSFAVE
jgi:hypothetical protein